MKQIDFQADQWPRFALIEQVRQKRQREDPETDYIYSHYYNPEWSIEELETLAKTARFTVKKPKKPPRATPGVAGK